jgi:hypothetical protein
LAPMKVRFTGIWEQTQTTSIFMFVVFGIEYKMVFKLTNIDDPALKALSLLSLKIWWWKNEQHERLNRIVIRAKPLQKLMKKTRRLFHHL